MLEILDLSKKNLSGKVPKWMDGCISTVYIDINRAKLILYSNLGIHRYLLDIGLVYGSARVSF